MTEKELVSPSIAKFSVGFRAFPDLSTIPLPLLDVSVPLMSRNSPAAGLEVIGSNEMVVGDLTVMVLIIVDDVCSVSEPFDQLNMRIIGIRPKGCEWGTENVKLTMPCPLVDCSGLSHVSWNSAETDMFANCLSASALY